MKKTPPPRDVVIQERVTIAPRTPTPRTPSLRPTGLGASPRFFGLYGLRGRANEHPITPEVALRLGRAVVWYAMSQRGYAGAAPRILLAKDTRLSGYLFETAISSGICSAGGNVVLCGPLPTPALAHLTQSMRVDAGIMVSASHNAYDDNGIKVFGKDGFSLPDDAEREIEQLMMEGAAPAPLPTGPDIGRAERLEDAQGRYVAQAKKAFPADLSLDGVRVVIDAAHGAAYRVGPRVLTELGASVVAVGVKPDGTNINKKGGSLNPDRARVHVVRKDAHVGMALDGDGDRVIMVDEQGGVLDGDTMLAICAAEMLERDALRHRVVVGTHMSNVGLERALALRGARLQRASVGERYVVEAMRRGGFTLGGEPSGHVVFFAHGRTGDGLVTALQVLAVMVRKNMKLSELARASMDRVPQVLESIALAARRPLDQMHRLNAAVAALTKELGDTGRVFVRWSQTEPRLRIMIEAPDEERIQTWASDLADAARADIAS